MTSIDGTKVTLTILALCVPELSHDILLGTKELEKYKISICPHLGEARMETDEGEVIFPMLDGKAIMDMKKSLSPKHSC